MSLTRNAKYNAYSGVFFFVVKMIVTFIMNPFLLGSLGSVFFGIWKTVENLLGFASIADGKATQALKWIIANQESSNDNYKKRRAVGGALVVWFLFLPFLIIIICTLTYFAPHLIKDIPLSDYPLIYYAFIVLGINLIITSLFGVFESILIGTNRGWITNTNHIFWTIFSAFSMFLILDYGQGLKGLIMVILFVSTLRGINIMVLCIKKIKWFGIKRPKKKEIKSFFNFSSWVLLWSFVAKFLLGSEVLLIGFLIGPEDVSKYSFTSYAAITGVSLSAVLMSSITPGLGRLFGNKEYEKFMKVMVKVRELAFALSIFFGATILLLNRSFIFLWESEERFIGIYENIIIVVLMIQLILIRNEGFLIDLGLKLKIKVLLGLLSVITISILAFFGFKYLSEDVWVILVSIFLGRLILILAFPTLVGRMIKKRIIMIPLKNIMIGVILIGATSVLGYYQLLNSWFSLIFIGIIEMGIVVFLIYHLLLGIDNKKFLREQYLLILKKNF